MATLDQEAFIRHRIQSKPENENDARSDQMRDQTCAPMAQEELLSDKELQTAPTSVSSTSASSSSSLSFENICWFIASILTIYITDIFKVILFDERVNR